MKTLSIWNHYPTVNPWRRFFDVDTDLDRFLDQMSGGSRWQDEASFQPACEIDETEGHFLMNVDLPGVAKKDIQVEVKDNQLTISGERKSEKKSAGYSERSYGKFYRVVTLPTGLDADKIEAQYQDGVLTLAVPKAETAKAKTIKISDGKGGFIGRLLNNKDSDKEEKNASSVNVA